MTASAADTTSAYDPAADRRAGALRRLARKVAPDGTALRDLRSLAALGRRADTSDPGAARQAATLLVSQLFFAPLLAEARKLPFGGEIGSGGRGEEVFGERLDLAIADSVAAGLRGGLRDQLESRLSQRYANRAPTEAVAPDAGPSSDPADKPAPQHLRGFTATADAAPTFMVQA